MLEQVEQLVVGPVDVLDQDHGGPLCRGCRQKLRPRVLEAVAHGQWMEVPGDVEAERQPEDLPVAEQLASPLGWIALEQPEVLTQHLAQRPVRDPRAVRQTPPGPPERFGILVGKRRPELSDEPRLPDSCVSEHRHEPRAPFLNRRLILAAEHLELVVAPNECACQRTDAAWAHQREGADEPPAGNVLLFSFRLDCLLLAELEGAADHRDASLSDKHLPGRRALLEPCRDIDRVAGDERAPFTRTADHDLTGVHADPELEAAVQLVCPVQHRQGRVQRALGVVLERSRHAECRHDRIAGELLDRAPRTFDLVGHRVVEAIEQDARALGILRASEGRRPNEVGEDNGCDLPLAGSRLGLHRSGAARAEASAGRELGTARGTGHAWIVAQPLLAVTSLTCAESFEPRSVIQTT